MDKSSILSPSLANTKLTTNLQSQQVVKSLQALLVQSAKQVAVQFNQQSGQGFIQISTQQFTFALAGLSNEQKKLIQQRGQDGKQYQGKAELKGNKLSIQFGQQSQQPNSQTTSSDHSPHLASSLNSANQNQALNFNLNTSQLTKVTEVGLEQSSQQHQTASTSSSPRNSHNDTYSLKSLQQKRPNDYSQSKIESPTVEVTKDKQAQIEKNLAAMSPEAKTKLQELLSQHQTSIENTHINPLEPKLEQAIMALLQTSLNTPLTEVNVSGVLSSMVNAAASSHNTSDNLASSLVHNFTLLTAAIQPNNLQAAGGKSGEPVLLQTLINLLYPKLKGKIGKAQSSGLNTSASPSIASLTALFSSALSAAKQLKQNRAQIAKWQKSETPNQEPVYLVLPFAGSDKQAEILLGQDQKGDAKSTQLPQWHFDLILPVGDLGKLYGKITWLKSMDKAGMINMTLASNTQALYEKLTKLSPFLEDRLKSSGFSFNQLDYRIGHVPDSLAPKLNEHHSNER